MMSRRHRALSALRDRLQAISVANGYRTDAGQALFMGQDAELGPDDARAAIALAVAADEVRHNGENVVSVIPVEVHALVKAAVDNPLLALEDLIGDIKKAVEQPDRTLGGLLVQRGLGRGSVRPIDREPGSEMVGAVVEYSLTMAEAWGNP